jgi:hypothetical protein
MHGILANRRRAAPSGDAKPYLPVLGSGRVDDWKELAPGTDRLGVLLGHRLDDLPQVVQIVHYPRGEELAERHLPKGGMDTLSPQVLDIDQRIQRLEIRGPHGRESGQKIAELPVPEADEPRFSIDGLEDAFRAVFEDHPRPVDPVALLDVGEVPDDLVGRPGVGPSSPVTQLWERSESIA